MMNMRPLRNTGMLQNCLLKAGIALVALVAVMMIGFAVAGLTAPHASGGSIPAAQPVSGETLFYLVLGVLDLAGFVWFYRLARQ